MKLKNHLFETVLLIFILSYEIVCKENIYTWELIDSIPPKAKQYTTITMQPYFINVYDKNNINVIGFSGSPEYCYVINRYINNDNSTWNTSFYIDPAYVDLRANFPRMGDYSIKNTPIFFCDSSEYYISRNNNLTWEKKKISDKKISPDAYSHKVNIGVLLGINVKDRTKHFSFTTKDSAKTWHEKELFIKNLNYNPYVYHSIDIIDSNNYIALASSKDHENILFSTSNAGINWDTITTFKSSFFKNVTLIKSKFFTKNFGYVVGYKEMKFQVTLYEDNVFYTKDGGKTWYLTYYNYDNETASGRLFKAHILDSNSIVLLGHGNRVTYLNNDKNLWFKENYLSDKVDIINDVACIGKDSLICITSNERIFRRIKKPVTEIKEHNSKNISDELEIFPNPVVDFLNIKLETSKNEISNLIIYDINGNELISKTPEINKEDKLELRIDVSKLNSGIYFLKYFKNNHTGIIKFIKI